MHAVMCVCALKWSLFSLCYQEYKKGDWYQIKFLVFNILLLPLIYTLYSCPLSHLYFGQRFCVSSMSHYVNLPSQYYEDLF